jgi:hypothetical protein
MKKRRRFQEGGDIPDIDREPLRDSSGEIVRDSSGEAIMSGSTPRKPLRQVMSEMDDQQGIDLSNIRKAESAPVRTPRIESVGDTDLAEPSTAGFSRTPLKTTAPKVVAKPKSEVKSQPKAEVKPVPKRGGELATRGGELATKSPKGELVTKGSDLVKRRESMAQLESPRRRLPFEKDMGKARLETQANKRRQLGGTSRSEDVIEMGMKRGGKVGSASSRGDGIAKRGKTRGRYI